MTDRHERIEILYSLRRYAEAERLAREQIAETPEKASAFAQLALCVSARGNENLSEAIDAAKTSLKYDSSQAFTHYLLGRLLSRSARRTAAAASFSEALRLSPCHALSRCELADIRFEKGERDEAFELIGEGLKYDPEHGDLLELKARLELTLDWMEAADETLRNALTLHSREARFHYLRALWHEREGTRQLGREQKSQYQLAGASIREALRLDPTDPSLSSAGKRIADLLSGRSKTSFFHEVGSSLPEWAAVVVVFVFVLLACLKGCLGPVRE